MSIASTGQYDTTIRHVTSKACAGISYSLLRVGRHALRLSLALVIGWIGAMKFTPYEAEGISGFVRNSPLLSWVYTLTSERGFSATLGIVELIIAAALVCGLFSWKCGAAGAAMAIGMFATTLSFMLSTPGVFEPSAGGFPALSVVPGQFLVKDFVLLGASIWLLGASLCDRADRTGGHDAA